MLLLSYSVGHATSYNAIFYETLRLANINFDDHVKALDYFIGKWKPLEKPIRSRDLLGRDKILYYEEPSGLDGGGGRDIVYENAKYISQLIYASRSPLLAIKKCHEQGKGSILDEVDTAKIIEALTLFGQASDIIREYAIRVYNIRQNFQDLTDLHATRAKILEGQAKLQEILARQPQKKN